MELPDGSITHYSYSSNTVTVNDPAGITKTFTMDAFGNLTQVQEPDPALGKVSTNYTYDMLNHLIQVSMPRGSNTQTRTFNYLTGTTVGINLLSATNPENGTVTYTYNSDNTLHTKTDAKNQVFTYSYDSYKRLTKIQVGPLRCAPSCTTPTRWTPPTLDRTRKGGWLPCRIKRSLRKGIWRAKAAATSRFPAPCSLSKCTAIHKPV
jgi:YD repeat-containing protein